jgi:hypothetical protein
VGVGVASTLGSGAGVGLGVGAGAAGVGAGVGVGGAGVGCEVAAGGSWDALAFGDAAFGDAAFGDAAFGDAAFGAVASVVDDGFLVGEGGSAAFVSTVAAGRGGVAVGRADDESVRTTSRRSGCATSAGARVTINATRSGGSEGAKIGPAKIRPRTPPTARPMTTPTTACTADESNSASVRGPARQPESATSRSPLDTTSVPPERCERKTGPMPRARRRARGRLVPRAALISLRLFGCARSGRSGRSPR